MFMAGLSFVLVALIQIALDRGVRLSVAWQLVPYIALTIGVVARLNVFSGAASFLFYAALVSLAGVGLGLVGRRHVNTEFFREG